MELCDRIGIFCNNLYNLVSCDYKQKMEDERMKYEAGDPRSNPAFYSGSTFIGDWTGGELTNRGYGSGFEIVDREAYFGTEAAKRTIDKARNLAISQGFIKQENKR